MVRRCTHETSKGKKCRNKALTNRRVCHCHDVTKPQKRPEKHGVLFHLFFLYGLRKYGNKDFLQLDYPGARGPWHEISKSIYGGLVNNIQVQSHANRYHHWMRKNNMVSRDAVLFEVKAAQVPSNKGKYCIGAPRMHMFLRFNEFTIMDLVYFHAVVMVNNIPYRMGVHTPQRVDDAFTSFQMDNTFVVLQALDAYHLYNNGTAYRDTNACPLLQQQCLEAARITAVAGNPRPYPLVSMSLVTHEALTGTCMDMIDHTNTPWQGTAPTVVDVYHLVRNKNNPFPVFHEMPPPQSYVAMLEETTFIDMPTLQTPKQCSVDAEPVSAPCDSPVHQTGYSVQQTALPVISDLPIKAEPEYVQALLDRNGDEPQQYNLRPSKSIFKKVGSNYRHTFNRRILKSCTYFNRIMGMKIKREI